MNNDIKGCWQCARYKECLANECCNSGVVRKRTYNIFYNGDDCFEDEQGGNYEQQS